MFDLFKRLTTAGGAPTTVDFVPLYQRYVIEEQTSGRVPIPMQEWLQMQGYTMDKKGLIYPVKDVKPPKPDKPMVDPSSDPQKISLMDLSRY